jgi:hypothetical protein
VLATAAAGSGGNPACCNKAPANCSSALAEKRSAEVSDNAIGAAINDILSIIFPAFPAQQQVWWSDQIEKEFHITTSAVKQENARRKEFTHAAAQHRTSCKKRSAASDRQAV